MKLVDVTVLAESRSVRIDAWGLRGPTAIARIQEGLGVTPGPQLHEFAIEIGNIYIGSFDVLVTGDDAGRTGAVVETLRLPSRQYAFASAPVVQVMRSDGVRYLYDPASEQVCSFDLACLASGTPIATWTSFDKFLVWAIRDVEHTAAES